jgi:hypothetical protein
LVEDSFAGLSWLTKLTCLAGFEVAVDCFLIHGIAGGPSQPANEIQFFRNSCLADEISRRTRHDIAGTSSTTLGANRP